MFLAHAPLHFFGKLLIKLHPCQLLPAVTHLLQNFPTFRMTQLTSRTPLPTLSLTSDFASPPQLKRRRVEYESTVFGQSTSADLPPALFLPTDLEDEVSNEFNQDVVPRFTLKPRTTYAMVQSPMSTPPARRLSIVRLKLDDTAEMQSAGIKKRRRSSLSNCAPDTLSSLSLPSLAGCA